MTDKTGENKAAATAAAIARRQWKEAQQRASKQPESSAWISVFDRLPVDSQTVFVANLPERECTYPLEMVHFYVFSKHKNRLQALNMLGWEDRYMEETPTNTDGVFLSMGSDYIFYLDDDNFEFWMPLPSTPYQLATR